MKHRNKYKSKLRGRQGKFPSDRSVREIWIDADVARVLGRQKGLIRFTPQPCRTLEDMSDEEKRALCDQYKCKIKGFDYDPRG